MPITSALNYSDAGGVDTTAPATPSAPTITALSNSSLNASWSAASDSGNTYYYYAKSYDLEGNDNDMFYDGGAEKFLTQGLWVSTSAVNDGYSIDNISYTGNYSVKQTLTNGPSCGNWGDCNKYFGSDFTFGTHIETGTMYEMKCMVKTNITSGYVKLNIERNGTYIYTPQISGVNDWTEIRTVFNTYGTGSIRLLAYSIDANGTVWWDDCHLNKIVNATITSGIKDYNLTGTNANAWTSALNYTVSGLSPNTQYCYTIKARDNGNTEGTASTSACAYTQASVPISVTATALNTSPLNSQQGTINVTWAVNGNPGGTAYNVYQNNTLVYTGTNTNYLNTTILDNAQYCYEITALNAIGLETGK
jgi:hypothetical protein